MTATTVGGAATGPHANRTTGTSQATGTGEVKVDVAGARSAFSDLTADVKELVQQEIALAKAEITSQAGKVGKGAGMFAGAALAAIMILIFLSTALWWALANVMDQSWAALIVAGVWTVIAVALVLAGRATLKSLSLKPERTLNSLKQIPGAVKARQGALK